MAKVLYIERSVCIVHPSSDNLAIVYEDAPNRSLIAGQRSFCLKASQYWHPSTDSTNLGPPFGPSMTTAACQHYPLRCERAYHFDGLFHEMLVYIVILQLIRHFDVT